MIKQNKKLEKELIKKEDEIAALKQNITTADSSWKVKYNELLAENEYLKNKVLHLEKQLEAEQHEHYATREEKKLLASNCETKIEQLVLKHETTCDKHFVEMEKLKQEHKKALQKNEAQLQKNEELIQDYSEMLEDYKRSRSPRSHLTRQSTESGIGSLASSSRTVQSSLQSTGESGGKLRRVFVVYIFKLQSSFSECSSCKM